MEESFGISEFLTESAGFSSVLKQRYSDFIVNEISLDGSIVRLTNLSYSTLSNESSSATGVDIITRPGCLVDDVEDQLNTLAASTASSANCDDNVSIVVASLSKDQRKEIHEFIRKKYNGCLESKTVTDAIVVSVAGQQQMSNSRKSKLWPENQPDHCKFVLYKENKDSLEALALVAKFLGLKANDFKTAGTKDKRAKTSQSVTVYRVQASRLADLNTRLFGIRLGNFTYIDDELKLGDLWGNQFTIVLRHVYQTTIEDCSKAIQMWVGNGFVNYFGAQRFGTTSVPTYAVGKMLLKSDWSAAVDLILQPRSEPNDFDLCYQRWSETKDAQNAFLCIPPTRRNTSIEGYLLKGLQKRGKNDFVGALQFIPRNTRLMYLHSYQSFIWNSVVSRRIRELGFAVMIGDLICTNADSTDGVFIVKSHDDVEKYSITDVVLPLPGFDVIYPENQTTEWYRELLEKDMLTLDSFKNRVKDYALPGGYRRLVIKPRGVDFKFFYYNDPTIALALSDLDMLQGKEEPQDLSTEDGKFLALRLRFDLPSSSYATMALRELTRMDMSAGFQRSLNDYCSAPVQKD